MARGHYGLELFHPLCYHAVNYTALWMALALAEPIRTKIACMFSTKDLTTDACRHEVAAMVQPTPEDSYKLLGGSGLAIGRTSWSKRSPLASPHCLAAFRTINTRLDCRTSQLYPGN